MKPMVVVSAGALALAMCLSPISSDNPTASLGFPSASANGLNNFGGTGGRFGVGPGDGSADAQSYGDNQGRFGAGGPFGGSGPFGTDGPFDGGAGGPPDNVGEGASTASAAGGGASNSQGAAHNNLGCTGVDCP